MKTTRLPIGKKTIVIIVILTVSGICAYKFMHKSYTPPPPSVGSDYISLYSTHSQFDEPHLKAGYFYLNGDTSECYFDVSENNTMQLCGNDNQITEMLSESLSDEIHQYPDIYDSDFISNEMRKTMDYWSEPRKFLIRTISSDGEIWIIYQWRESENNEVYIVRSIEYSDENTINYGGLIFTLIDNKLTSDRQQGFDRT